MKKVWTLCLAFLLCFGFSACANSSAKLPPKEKTEKEIVLEEIEKIGREEYKIWKINKKELKASAITVATIKKTEENLYHAYGKILFVDVYGDTYEKNVEVIMKGDEKGRWNLESIDIDGFEYEMLYHW
ncbi:MAG: hypothetical protein E7223_04790 [Clostridiales bacterium]|nr:hypothetical protein [Clostridiales bacterium]